MPGLANWFINASRRTFFAFWPGLLRVDDAFAQTRLSPAEYALYLRMDVRDRHHAREVAQTLLAAYPRASAALVRAALLHDVGKIGAPHRALERIFVHLYTPRDLPAEPRMSGIKGMWQRHLHHDRYGAELIRAAGGSARVAEIVARHHTPRGDAEAAILAEIDRQF